MVSLSIHPIFCPKSELLLFFFDNLIKAIILLSIQGLGYSISRIDDDVERQNIFMINNVPLKVITINWQVN